MDPTWSPDGTTVAFLRQERRAARAPFDLWRMSSDGRDERLIARDVSHASWSPDGKTIAFIRGGRPYETAYQGAPAPQGLWVTAPDGSLQVEVAKAATEFAWRPTRG